MSETNDGGPAFPVPIPMSESSGMSLRDWLAAQASERDIARWNDNMSEVSFWSWMVLAPLGLGKYKQYTREQARYRYADAMLAERSKP